VIKNFVSRYYYALLNRYFYRLSLQINGVIFLVRGKEDEEDSIGPGRKSFLLHHVSARSHQAGKKTEEEGKGDRFKG
jgi:hypothetical protein